MEPLDGETFQEKLGDLHGFPMVAAAVEETNVLIEDIRTGDQQWRVPD